MSSLVADQVPQIDAAQKKKISLQEFQSKYKSKREVWNFLAVQVGAYLPQFETVNIYFLRDLVSGKKKIIKSFDVKHLNVPQYESLTIKHIMNHAQGITEVMERLPDPKDISRLPKQYLINVVYTVCGDPFADWVKEKVEERNNKVSMDKGLLIEVDEEIANAFATSTAISQSRGISAQMMKVGTKRRRSKAQIAADKEEAQIKQQQVDATFAQINDLQQQLAQAKQQAEENAAAHNILGDLVNKGEVQVDNKGNAKVSKRNRNRPQSPMPS